VNVGWLAGRRAAKGAKDALLQLQALHHTHREATRFFAMTVRQGGGHRPQMVLYGKVSLISLILHFLKAKTLQTGSRDWLRDSHGNCKRGHPYFHFENRSIVSGAWYASFYLSMYGQWRRI